MKLFIKGEEPKPEPVLSFELFSYGTSVEVQVTSPDAGTWSLVSFVVNDEGKLVLRKSIAISDDLIETDENGSIVEEIS